MELLRVLRQAEKKSHQEAGGVEGGPYAHALGLPLKQRLLNWLFATKFAAGPQDCATKKRNTNSQKDCGWLVMI